MYKEQNMLMYCMWFLSQNVLASETLELCRCRSHGSVPAWELLDRASRMSMLIHRFGL